MCDFPDLPEEVAKEVDVLIRSIRAGADAERRLTELVGRHPHVMAWLRDAGILRREADHPDADAALQEGLAGWLAELKARAAPFADAPAFWSWFRGIVRRASVAMGAAELNESRAIRRSIHEPVDRRAEDEESESDASRSPSGDHRSHRSSQLLIRDEMKVFEPLFERPGCHEDSAFFELLCRALFRLRVWRYLARRRKDSRASPRHLLLSDAKLATLVFGFGQTAEERASHRRKINNWLRPSMARFRQVNNRELIRRIMREATAARGDNADESAEP